MPVAVINRLPPKVNRRSAHRIALAIGLNDRPPVERTYWYMNSAQKLLTVTLPSIRTAPATWSALRAEYRFMPLTGVVGEGGACSADRVLPLCAAAQSMMPTLGCGRARSPAGRTAGPDPRWRGDAP